MAGIRLPVARASLAIGVAIVMAAATAVWAQTPPSSADVPADPLADRLQHMSDFAEGALGPQERKMIEGLKAEILANQRPANDNTGARFGGVSPGKPSEGGYDLAESLLRSALDADETTLGPNHPGTATGLDRLARMLVSQGRYAEAEPLLRRALKIDELALPHSPHTADILNDLATLLVATDRDGEAEPLLRRGLEIDEEILGPDSASVADALNTLTNVLASGGRTAEAEAAARRALSIDERILGVDSDGVADDLNILAGLLEAEGRYADAEPLLERALTIDTKLLGPAHPNTANVEVALAVAEFGLGRFEPAVQLMRPACKALAAGVVSRGAHGDTHLQSRDQAAGCASTLSQFLWAWSVRGGGHEASDRPDALVLEAFEAAQLSLDSRAGDALAHYGARTAAAAAGVGEQADAYETALLERDRLDVEIARAAGDAEGGEQTKGLEKARDDVASRIDRLGATLKSLAGRYWDYRASQPVSVAALQARAGDDAVLLNEDEALILFLIPPGDARGLVFAVSKDKVAWAQIGGSGDELRAKVRALRKMIDPRGYGELGLHGQPEAAPAAGGAPLGTRSHRQFDRQISYEIYIALLGDAGIQGVIADKTTLLFVPSGPMTSLPPALLVTTPPRGGAVGDEDPTALRETSWLLRRTAIAVLPTVSALRTLRQILPAMHQPPPDPLLAFADPDFGTPSVAGPGMRGVYALLRDQPPPRLDGTGPEADALRQALGAGPESLLLGRDASKRQLMSRNADGRLAKVRVLEFATHAAFADEFPGLPEPALVMAAGAGPEDELLLASEATSLRLNAEWVLLSACDTASPDSPEERGLSGLSRAFFFAGARSLLVSHWHVYDVVTSKLIPAVMSAERDDPALSRAQALRKASLAILDNPAFDGPGFTAATPAAWAPFVLVGEPGR
jgi:CHAT domain-containing protein/tetratricopeptide (TPR) repeat protein